MNAPPSPGKMALHRANATASRHQQKAASMSFGGVDMLAGDTGSGRRGRQPFLAKPPTPPTPGKENRPLSSEFRYGELSKQQAPISASTMDNPTKKSKGRGRSVSPSKAFRLRGKGGDGSAKEEDEIQYPSRSVGEIEHDFVSMLGEMQVPAALMHKLMGLDSRVKESMIKGQATLNFSSLQHGGGKHRIPLSGRFSRSKSTVNLTNVDVSTLSPPDRSSVYMRQASSGSSTRSDLRTSSPLEQHAGALFSQSSVSLNTIKSRSASFVSKDGGGHNGATAISFATLLKANDVAHLDVGKVKQMRAVLAAESPAWLEEFFDEGGFRAMTIRLQELLQMEWREEQHDDQLLHELLRCFVVLGSTKCGQHALTSASPTPFVDLCDLLYSEKKPGDLSTRKLLLEMLLMLPDLPAQHHSGSASPSEVVRSSRVSSSLLRSNESRSRDCNYELLLTLLHNQRDPAHEAVVDFITASHTPRPFKSWVSEMLNVSRDYFWIFCHSTNRFWDLNGIDVDEAQGPKVPGGMTGGVEFEAMSYLTCHFRLVNRLAAYLPTGDHSSPAYHFHSLLFNSGFERALTISRKASQTYYQALHLEMARYFSFARKARFDMPVELEAWQSRPQLMPEGKPPALPLKRSTQVARAADVKPVHDAPAITLDLGSSLASSCDLRSNANTSVSNAVRQWEQRTSPARPAPPSGRHFVIEDTAFSWV